MKKFLYSIPDKWKAIYILWFFIHFILWLSGGGDFGVITMSKHHAFFPFEWAWNGYSEIELGFSLNTHWNYGLDVFLIYSVTPIVLFYFFRLWKKKEN